MSGASLRVVAAIIVSTPLEDTRGTYGRPALDTSRQATGFSLGRLWLATVLWCENHPMVDSRLATGLGLAMLAALALALTWAVAAVLSVDRGADLATTYAAALPAARVADIAAGLGLIVAGGLATTQPRTRRLGVLALLAGLAWFGADWEGAESAGSVLRSFGAAVTPLDARVRLPSRARRARWPRALPGGAAGDRRRIRGRRAV